MSDRKPLLVIGNKHYSSWSLRPWLLLRQFGVEFSEQRLPLDTDQFHAEIHRWSPTARVPALHHDGLMLWDSLAICEYVNETWADGRGWPGDKSLRALARCAVAEMHSGFAALRQQLPMNCSRQPDGYRWDANAQADIDRMQRLWTDLLQLSQGPFLAGPFGIIDAMFAPVAIRFRGYGVSLSASTQAYVDTLLALPAMAEWIDAGVAETERLPKYEALDRNPG